MKRMLCLLLAMIMLFTSVPTGVIATEPAETEVPVSTEAGAAENTEPAATEAAGTETEATEPEATGSETAEPEPTEPEATEHAHTYEAQVTVPDCANQGFTTYACVCGDSYVDDYVDALGHVYSHMVCTRCGEAAPGPVVKAENDEDSGQIELTWNSVDGAYCYMVYRCVEVDGEFDFEPIDLTADTEYVDEDCDLNVCYYYQVVAAAPDGSQTAPSEAVSAYRRLPAPEVTAFNSEETGKPRLTWNRVKGAVRYEVYRSTKENGPYSRTYRTSGTSYTNTKAVPGKTYYYKVRAVAADSDSNSVFSEVFSRSCEMARPVVSVSNELSTGHISLTWKPVQGASCYMVYWSDSLDGTYQMVSSTTGTGYVHESGEIGNTYYFKVMGVGDDLEHLSPESKIVSGSVLIPGTKITSATNDPVTGDVQLTWEAVDAALGYAVYRSESSDGPYEALLTTIETSFTDLTAAGGITYYYRVQALSKNPYANSQLSEVRKRSCDCVAPEITVAVNGSGKPRVTWEAVDGALTYKVYRSSSKDGTYKLMYNTSGTSYSNTTAKVGVTYYYKVKAVGVDSTSASSYSNTVSCAAVKNVYQYVFSSYSTSKYGTAGRNTNLALACKAINGTILAPGDEFSFNEVVGPRTEKKGYQLATVFNDVGIGRGGGVCQVATTLFNCALIGNLEISKRRQHSIAVTYVPLGRDATVYKKVKDFCFVNDSDYYIKIKASASGGIVSISFLTREANVSPKSKVKLRVTEKDGVYTLTRSYEGVVNYTATSKYK